MKTEDDLKILLRDYSHNSLCRVCLTECLRGHKSLFKIHNSVAPSTKILLCTRVEIAEGDGLPSVICEQCCAELDAADSFRVKCEYSETLLKKIAIHSHLPSTPEGTKYKSLIDDECRALSVIKSLLVADKFDAIKEEPLQNGDTIFKSENAHELRDSDIPGTEKSELDFDIKVELDDYNHEDSFGVCGEEMGSIPKRKSSKLKEFICNVCGESLKDRRLLKKHIKLLHYVPDVPDTVQVTGFGKERVFHCRDCEYHTKFRKNITPHLRTHTGEKPYRCEECGKCYAHNDSLLSHKTTHSDRMNFTCAECGKQFKYKKGLIKHKRAHSTEKNYRCTLCSKAMKSRYSLEDHMNRHFNIRNFSCETCGDIFVTRSGLTNHVKRVHIRDKKYQCHLCEYATYTRERLDVHIRRHTGERTHGCQVCEYSCYTKSSLNAHMRRHTKDRNYGCTECEARFKHSSGLHRHMLTVHGKKYKRTMSVETKTFI